jgi:spore coat polysaccharide biosynthesis protein SpsF (cytidylyltransferase family)
VRRCFHYKIKPIICTTVARNDNEIIILAKKLKVSYFRGSENNKILRISQCCKKFNINFFHTIDADDPFFCGVAVKKSLNEIIKNNFDIIKPTQSSSMGSGLLGYSAKAAIFHLISQEIHKNTNTEMMWGFFKKISKLKIKKLKELPFAIKARLTLDYHEDYIFLETIRLLLGNFATRKSISNLIKKNSDIVKINMFRNSQWIKNQKKIIAKIK